MASYRYYVYSILFKTDISPVTTDFLKKKSVEFRNNILNLSTISFVRMLLVNNNGLKPGRVL